MAISIAPSQYWEGNDGPWSTFAFQVGTPPQSVRVLPSSSQSSIWVVIPEGCEAPGDTTDCSNARGIVFDYSNSTSFARVGKANQFFELPLQPEASLGYYGNSIVGHDRVVLGWDGSNAPAISNQIVTGFTTKEPFLGILGLSARPVNITNWNDQYDSPLAAIVANKTRAVGSAFWAYTAGARYRTPQSYGSLTLGGYDSARGNVDHVLEVSFGINTYRDLVLVLKSFGISSPDGTTTMRDLSIWVFIDSTVPEIWLPVTACQEFESAFSLTWDNATNMYPVNDTLHAQLRSSDQTVSFVLAETADSNAATTTIVLPYSSFDLTATSHASGSSLNESQRYFPLRRAENDTQYVFGRTFLQDAYLAVDYDRSKFYVSPATFPDDQSTSNVTAVLSPKASKGNGLGDSKIGGLSVGLFVAVVLGACCFYCLYWQPQQKKRIDAELALSILATTHVAVTQGTYGNAHNGHVYGGVHNHYPQGVEGGSAAGLAANSGMNTPDAYLSLTQDSQRMDADHTTPRIAA